MTGRPLQWLVVVVSALALAACGGTTRPLGPRALPADIIPASIPDATDPANPYTLVEFAAARDRFSKAGRSSLVDDGRLYEVRRGSNLVGTVEVGALKAEVDLSVAANRKQLINLLMPGSASTVRIHGVSVVRSTSAEKSTYLVLGNGLFQLVDVKPSDKVDPNRLVTALIDAQVPLGHLKLTTDTTHRRPL